MKLKALSLYQAIALPLLMVYLSMQAQTRPWPQNITYSFGAKVSHVSQTTLTNNAAQAYAQWKSDFVTSTNAGGFRRVKYQQASNWTYSASEGTGYGMLLSVYSADKTLFDDLCNFYKSKRNAQNLMSWKIDYNGNCGGGDCYSATDGDEDIAFSLILAHCQWGSTGSINYLQEAIGLINAIKTYEVDLPAGRLRPGEFFGGSHCVDPSYFTVAYYPYFKAVTNDNSWDVVRNWCLQYFANNAHPISGLYRDWSRDDGGTAYNDCSWRESNYAYDASRIPWRLANDYLWHGTAISQQACSNMVLWTRNDPPISGNAGNFNDCLNWDGSGHCGNYANIPIVGGMSIGAMALAPGTINDTWRNNLYSELANRNDDYFYNRTLQVIYYFVHSGNFWPPDCVGNTLKFKNNMSPTTSNSNLNNTEVKTILSTDRTLSLNSKLPQEASILVIGCDGKDYTKECKIDNGSIVLSHTMVAGLYFIRMEYGQKLFQIKCILQPEK
ncbi:MAG: glycosyl hydrolase family 8 [Cytophagaceae bacterium]|nr:glycosyl hydrolase family 8 [Cytophagaceae bacterium]